MKGRVKWWSNERGYGFIEYDESGNIFICCYDNSGKYIKLEIKKTKKGYNLKRNK